MDRARAASALRDARKKKQVDQLARDLLIPDGAIPPPARSRNKYGRRARPECPVCPPSSFSTMTWDARRGQWWHRGCNGLFGPEDVHQS
jgi:hypothetical protein